MKRITNRDFVKYKTERRMFVPLSIFVLLLCIIGGIAIFEDGYSPFAALFIWLMGILFFIYCLCYDLKRNRFKKKGVQIQGHIVGAIKKTHIRYGDTRYYLKVHFFENGNKIYITEGYFGDPNIKLEKTDCHLYRWKGKYIEADLNTRRKRNRPRMLNIPIEQTFSFSTSKCGKVFDA